jgi:hypothetical protein
LNYISDILAIAGLGLLGYGLYLYDPRISFTVCGAIMLSGGVYLAAPSKKRVE